MIHSIVSPSKAHIWTNCTAYVPVSSSSFAGKLGTELHALAEHFLKSGENPEYTVASYVEFVRSIAGKLVIESPVNLDYLMGTFQYNLGYGYCDAYVLNKENKTLTVIDFKTGRTPVSPEWNMQLMIYAYCIIKGAFYSIDKVNLVIYQDQPKSWICSFKDLESFILDRIVPGVHLVLSGVKVHKPGSYCKWCKIQNECNQYLKELDEVETDPVKILEKAKSWENIANVLKEKIKNGEIQNDRIEVSTRKTYKWRDDADIPDECLDLVPTKPNAILDEMYPGLIEVIESKMVKVK